MNYDHLFKLVIAGSSGVGKSSLVQRFAEGTFSEEFNCTIGVDFWDTAGMERFRSITKAYYRGASGIILVYDVTKERSFDNIPMWLEQAKHYTSNDTPVLLVGNKCDIDDKRVVDYWKAKAYADQANIQYIETSAKEDINVELAFISFIALIKGNMSLQTLYTQEKHSQQKCC